MGHAILIAGVTIGGAITNSGLWPGSESRYITNNKQAATIIGGGCTIGGYTTTNAVYAYPLSFASNTIHVQDVTIASDILLANNCYAVGQLYDCTATLENVVASGCTAHYGGLRISKGTVTLRNCRFLPSVRHNDPSQPDLGSVIFGATVTIAGTNNEHHRLEVRSATGPISGHLIIAKDTVMSNLTANISAWTGADIIVEQGGCTINGHIIAGGTYTRITSAGVAT